MYFCLLGLLLVESEEKVKSSYPRARLREKIWFEFSFSDAQKNKIKAGEKV